MCTLILSYVIITAECGDTVAQTLYRHTHLAPPPTPFPHTDIHVTTIQTGGCIDYIPWPSCSTGKLRWKSARTLAPVSFRLLNFPGPASFPSITLATTFTNSRQAEKNVKRLEFTMDWKEKKTNNTKQNMQRHLRHGELPVKQRTKQIVWLLTRSARSIYNLWPVSGNLSKWKSLLEFLMHQLKEPDWNTCINHCLTALGGIQAQFFWPLDNLAWKIKNLNKKFKCLISRKWYWRRTTSETVQWAIKLTIHKQYSFCFINDACIFFSFVLPLPLIWRIPAATQGFISCGHEFPVVVCIGPITLHYGKKLKLHVLINISQKLDPVFIPVFIIILLLLLFWSPAWTTLSPFINSSVFDRERKNTLLALTFFIQAGWLTPHLFYFYLWELFPVVL